MTLTIVTVSMFSLLGIALSISAAVNVSDEEIAEMIRDVKASLSEAS